MRMECKGDGGGGGGGGGGDVGTCIELRHRVLYPS